MGIMYLLTVGVVCGVVGCIPSAFLFEEALKQGRRVNVGEGLRSILVSFAMLSFAIVVVWLVDSSAVLWFGCAMIASFLLFWAVEALRGWRAANSK